MASPSVGYWPHAHLRTINSAHGGVPIARTRNAAAARLRRGTASGSGVSRAAREASAGLIPFDQNLTGHTLPRWRILWVDNPLNTCDMWSYYCDLKRAMSRLHEVEDAPHASSAEPDLIVVGPKFATGLLGAHDGLGFSRQRYARVPIALFQNKMYKMTSPPEFTGSLEGKLRWASTAGVAAAFTWIGTRHLEYTQRSGVPHHWLPFAADEAVYASERRPSSELSFDVGFTGAADRKYPLRGPIMRAIATMNVSSFLGSWSFSHQHGAQNTGANVHWQKRPLSRREYARQIARTKLWVSTTGPEQIVGTRYFEVLMSGTTLLLTPPTLGI